MLQAEHQDNVKEVDFMIEEFLNPATKSYAVRGAQRKENWRKVR